MRDKRILLGPSSLLSHDFPARKKLLFANPQKVFSLPKLAFEVHALAIWNVEMTRRSICFPDFPAVSHVRRYSRQVSAASF